MILKNETCENVSVPCFIYLFAIPIYFFIFKKKFWHSYIFTKKRIHLRHSRENFEN